MKVYRIAVVLSTVLALSACSFSMPEFKIPRVHKISVQQGNVITQDMIDQLKPGMTRSQVAYIMGEPIFRNTFNDDRWDYIYTIAIPGFFEQDMRMSLFFQDNALAYFTGDLAPTDADDENTTSEIGDSNSDTEEDA